MGSGLYRREAIPVSSYRALCDDGIDRSEQSNGRAPKPSRSCPVVTTEI